MRRKLACQPRIEISPATIPSRLNFRVEILQLDAGVSGGKLPGDPGLAGIPPTGPGSAASLHGLP